jgi:hypothetical protein
LRQRCDNVMNLFARTRSCCGRKPVLTDDASCTEAPALGQLSGCANALLVIQF